MGIDAATQMLYVLEALRSQGLLGTHCDPVLSELGEDGLRLTDLAESFLPFDLEAVFISSVSLLAASAFEINLVHETHALLQKSYAVFDDLCDSGNLIAKQEKLEVRSFEDALRRINRNPQAPAALPTASPTSASTGWESGISGVSIGPSFPTPAPTAFPNEPQPFGIENIDDLDLFTSAHILDTVNAIDTGDADWMSQAMTEYNLW